MDVNITGAAGLTNLPNAPSVPTPNPVQTGSAAATVPVAAVVSGNSNGTNSPTPTLAQVKQVVSNINSSLSDNGYAQNVQFAVDPSSKKVVVQVIDPETNKVIRQIPSEEIIQIGMTIGQKLGQLINQQA